jgi:hypothetical protein
VAIVGAQINRPARAAARTEDIQPGRPGDQRGPDGGRPRRVTAGCRFQRSTTSSASARAARSALSFAAPVSMSSPRVQTPIDKDNLAPGEPAPEVRSMLHGANHGRRRVCYARAARSMRAFFAVGSEKRRYRECYPLGPTA